MKLTNYTDYSLRVLIFLAAERPGELSNIKQIAETYSISKNHLMKVIYRLGQLGYVETIRGRGGGIRLGMDPEDINIGEVVRKTEDDFNIVECFDANKNLCVISPVCGLKHVLNEALLAYLAVLDRYTLRDLVKNKEDIMKLLKMKE
ncbi:nitric oxide-sensing transcriptional repressor NsrR [Bacillus subtilis]|jgi:Rrf2 family nitric oxide-sensitive transcriptional repressor|uniref:nitric oxide-sensing transcriptional repressor NsrR n=1 Tax=Bacillus TaxID=1386 RepID=UPI00022BB306|nr:MULTISPECIES: nitric oxide-sensing transcriptional repressor NsrR [Bacillus]MBW4825899.1 nitric oxide-sensing transcriptional repressor NsrR [Bacillaceae bacterium]MUG01089.1 nitric oxide-sensing transcriptional repressor NsrR [Bacillus tequilensis]AEP90036.1 rrf2 family protein family protein [Bacillus subtilis subsp. subtilis str. RO-NN-1]AJO57570.1 Rrf2 family transcriptional regulator [Bacillus sp. YP1]AOY06545.1 Rrf2 family transcriptional regulator [Bacillus subtilis]